MRAMGPESMAPKPSTATPSRDHKFYPWLPRGLDIDGPNQVWATDVAYVPTEHRHLHMGGLDWWSRKILSCRPSNSLDSRSCVAALKEALARFDPPKIFNTDREA